MTRPEPARPRVVLVAIDGFPFDHLGPALTPRLAALDGSPGGGIAVLPSTTYPGFSSLVTGVRPVRHGVRVTGEHRGAVPGWAGTQVVGADTILERAAVAGLRVRSVVGDQKLVRVLRLGDAGPVWPAGGVVSAGSEIDAHGYPTNAAVRPALLAAAREDDDLVFVHLNETDTLGHDLGPGAPETVECVRDTDRLVGELLDALADDWARTVVLVASDHDMEPRTANEPIRLLDPGPLDGLADAIAPDGGAALARLRPGASVASVSDALRGDARFAAVEAGGSGIAVVGCARGWTIAGSNAHTGGEHGGAATTRTLALVGGGHPGVPAIGASLRATRPELIDWAPTIAAVLGFGGGGFDGRSLRPASA